MFQLLNRLFIFSFTMAIVISIAPAAFSFTTLPKGLNATDRERMLEALGFGSAMKMLSSPYPLGGYSGVEVGLSSEYISMADVAVLGAKTNSRSDLNYFNLTVGKGLYHNVDLLIQFIPMPQEESISGFGGQLRFGFYQANFMPLNLSFVTSATSTNFYNLIGAETTGYDLVASVNMKDVSLFFGAGQARSSGTFIGGANGITSSGTTENTNVSSPHTVFGISIKMANVFLALEVDRFVQSSYAGKLGLRF